jgi:hypothetical protein
MWFLGTCSEVLDSASSSNPHARTVCLVPAGGASLPQCRPADFPTASTPATTSSGWELVAQVDGFEGGTDVVPLTQLREVHNDQFGDFKVALEVVADGGEVLVAGLGDDGVTSAGDLPGGVAVAGLAAAGSAHGWSVARGIA